MLDWNKYAEESGYTLKDITKTHVIVEKDGLLFKFSRRAGIFSTQPNSKKAVDKAAYLLKQLQDMGIFCDRYDYSKIRYEGYTKKSEVVCKEHGPFYISPANLLKGRGCRFCAYESRGANLKKSFSTFLDEAKLAHGDKYVYMAETFQGSSNTLSIVCKDHGIFSQAAIKHTSGQGCPECSKSYLGHSKTSFTAVCDKNGEGLGTFYILNCKQGSEVFYKIGITSLSVQERYRKRGAMPYNFSILLTAEGIPEEIYALEKQMFKDLREYKYTPEMHFEGETECFSSCLTETFMLDYVKNFGLLISTLDKRNYQNR